MGTNSTVDEAPTAPGSGCGDQLYHQETDAGNARRSGADLKPYATPRLLPALPSVERAAPPPQATDASSRAMPIRFTEGPPGKVYCRTRISGDSSSRGPVQKDAPIGLIADSDAPKSLETTN